MCPKYLYSAVIFNSKLDYLGFWGNCPPTPPLSQHFALSEKQVITLALGRGRWAVSQKPKLIDP